MSADNSDYQMPPEAIEGMTKEDDAAIARLRDEIERLRAGIAPAPMVTVLVWRGDEALCGATDETVEKALGAAGKAWRGETEWPVGRTR